MIDAYNRCEEHNDSLDWRSKYPKNCSFPEYNPNLQTLAIKTKRGGDTVEFVSEVGVRYVIITDFDTISYVTFDSILSCSVMQSSEISSRVLNEKEQKEWEGNLIF